MKTYKQFMTEKADQFRDVSDSPTLERGRTEIWYSKKNEFRDFSGGSEFLNKHMPEKMPTTVKDLTKTHALIGKIKETNLDKIFMLMQGENWSPNGEANDLIRRSGSGHTSMSVGDIIVINGKMSMVDPSGFQSI